jgi:hypothetical protein
VFDRDAFDGAVLNVALYMDESAWHCRVSLLQPLLLLACKCLAAAAALLFLVKQLLFQVAFATITTMLQRSFCGLFVAEC